METHRTYNSGGKLILETVEIIRCRDCKFSAPVFKKNIIICKFTNSPKKPDFFCGDAEVKK